MVNKKKRQIIFIVCFIIIGIFLAYILEQIVMPKWYYPDKTLPEAASRSISGFYNEEPDTIDCMIFGTSHALYGIQTMELYKNYGLASYNLSTSSQPIQVSYYLLKEAFQYQSPDVVLLDVSSLFYGATTKDPIWHFALDGMKFGRNKLELADTFAKISENETMISAVSKLYRYHERWSELKESDFTDFFRNRHFYNKGSHICNHEVAARLDIEIMNDCSVHMEKDVEISDENIQYLIDIQNLCQENQAQLILMKVPAIGVPMMYSGAWTAEKSEMVSELAGRMEIQFFDMLYHQGTYEIDWSKDSDDGGHHLNIRGAVKVTNLLGEYLSEQVVFQKRNRNNEQWEEDLRVYEAVKSVAFLGMEKDFSSYLRWLIKEKQHLLILMSASDEMTYGLTDEEKALLAELGCEVSFDENAYRDAYIFVEKEGHVLYEKLSEQQLQYTFNLENSDSVQIISKGFLIGAQSSIRIHKKEHGINSRGINIVVYDTEAQTVIDSVCFDTCDVNHTVRRGNNINIYLREYEKYLIEENK